MLFDNDFYLLAQVKHFLMVHSKFNRCLFALVLFLTGSAGEVAYTQDTTNTIGNVTIASPTAASLGKYGDIPVGYHTGIPQISIPIYTVQSGSLSLPISLSYHASGLKVMEPASWVGAGWSLNAGGMISRTVRGAPDDRGYSTSNVLDGYYTDFGYNSYLNNGPNTPDDVNFNRGFKDGEPDLYFFNFGSYTGKFYFNDDRTPILVPEQDFRIQTFFATGQGFTGFIVTTPDGTRYYFGQVGNNGPVTPIEATNPFTIENGPSNTSAAASSWFLNKIVSSDGMDSITLSYATENYSYYNLLMHPVLSENYYPNMGPGNTNGFSNGLDVSKNLTLGVRLTKITFPNGSVTFTPAASPRTDLSSSAGLLSSNSMADAANTSSYALGSITISNTSGFCKKDSLYHGYFYDNTALNGTFWNGFGIYNIQSDEYRLRLDSMQELSCDASLKVPPYKFTYFSEQLPRMLSFAADHWGYPNGATSNTGMVPTFTQVVNGAVQTTTGANRDAAWPAMRAGSLQQITYPTGGYTLFNFEPKNIYTFSSSVLEEVPLTSCVINEYGQSRLTQTSSFTVSGTGATVIVVNNHDTAWSPTFSIVNSGGVQQGGGPWLVGTLSTLNQTFTLPAGTYTATLSYPTNSHPVNGADASIDQWQYVANSSTQTVGGLRIQSITQNDALTANNIVTSYNYTGGGTQTTGVLYSIPVYVQVLRSDILKVVWGELPSNQFCSPNGCFTCDGFSQHDYYISPGSILPMDNLQGENMGYNEVDVSQTGNGHSVYRYYGSNIWSMTINDVCQRNILQSGVCDASIPSFPYTPIPFEFMRDELQYEGHFNQSGQILKESYYFPTFKADSLLTPGHISANPPGLWGTFSEYDLQSARKTKDSVVSNLYDPSTGAMLTTTNSTYYGSPFHHQPTRKVTSTSTGDSLSTNIKYSLDFRVSSCDAIPDSLTYYLNSFLTDSAWMNTNINSCSPQVNNTNNCRWATYTTFREMLSQSRINFIHYRRRSYAADSANLLANCYATAEAGADTLLKPILRLQDEFNIVPIEVTQWKDLNLKHASFTKYDTSVSPVGVVYPDRTQLINLQATSSSFTPAAVSGSSITKDSRYLDETIYKFSNGNPQHAIPHSGIPNAYVWDYQNKEPIAKVSNATVDQIAYTSFEADGSGSWTIGSPSRDTGSITGTHCYNLTNGACSRSGLTSAATYVVSYWSKTGSSYSVSGSTGVVQGKTIAGWTYFEHTVTGVTTETVSGTGDIDELRLYPANAQMTTYTYTPLVGMTSQCDVDNRVTYYFYDNLGRLKWVKDQDLNIIKTLQYHYQTAAGQQY
jgi:hypothetical protein